jgi:hypothetical protein
MTCRSQMFQTADIRRRLGAATSFAFKLIRGPFASAAEASARPKLKASAYSVKPFTAGQYTFRFALKPRIDLPKGRR